MVTGTIKKIVDGKGFGFVSIDGAVRDVFLHHSAFDGRIYFDQNLVGREVEIEVAEDPGKGPRATFARLVT